MFPEMRSSGRSNKQSGGIVDVQIEMMYMKKRTLGGLTLLPNADLESINCVSDW